MRGVAASPATAQTPVRMKAARRRATSVLLRAQCGVVGNGRAHKPSRQPNRQNHASERAREAGRRPPVCCCPAERVWGWGEQGVRQQNRRPGSWLAAGNRTSHSAQQARRRA